MKRQLQKGNFSQVNVSGSSEERLVFFFPRYSAKKLETTCERSVQIVALTLLGSQQASPLIITGAITSRLKIFQQIFSQQIKASALWAAIIDSIPSASPQ